MDHNAGPRAIFSSGKLSYCPCLDERCHRLKFENSPQGRVAFLELLFLVDVRVKFCSGDLTSDNAVLRDSIKCEQRYGESLMGIQEKMLGITFMGMDLKRTLVCSC